MKNAGVDRLAALNSAIAMVRRGGTISLSGVYGGAADPINMMTLFDKQMQLRMGQANVKRWVPDILPLLTDDDPLGTESFATHRLPLNARPDAYEKFQKKQDGMVKVVLTPELRLRKQRPGTTPTCPAWINPKRRFSMRWSTTAKPIDTGSPRQGTGRAEAPTTACSPCSDANRSVTMCSPAGGLDDRRSRGEFLKRAEDLMAEAVGADAAFFSTCGSSLSVKAAMMAVAGGAEGGLLRRPRQPQVDRRRTDLLRRAAALDHPTLGRRAALVPSAVARRGRRTRGSDTPTPQGR